MLLEIITLAPAILLVMIQSRSRDPHGSSRTLWRVVAATRSWRWSEELKMRDPSEADCNRTDVVVGDKRDRVTKWTSHNI